jgi:hypothetical protein
MHSSRLLQFQQLAAKRNALLILRNTLTCRAKQGHDATIAAPGTEEPLVTQRAIPHSNLCHRRFAQSTQAGAHSRVSQPVIGVS